MDAALLMQAIEYAKTRDSNWGKTDYMADRSGHSAGRWAGPAVARSDQRRDSATRLPGRRVRRHDVVEPTYSVAKSYLSTILGLTIDRGMIRSIKDPVGEYVRDGGYDSPHNAKITWEDHARQASEWEGTMFGKPSTFIGAKSSATAR